MKPRTRGTAGSSRTVAPAPGSVREAIARARDYLLVRQHKEGYWLGSLENDTSCTGQYLLLCRYVNLSDPIRTEKAVRYLQRTRNEEGGWVQVPGGPSHLDVTLINYLALSLAGVPEAAPEMERSRQLVRKLGGLAEANFLNRIMLAFFGVFPLESLPWVSTGLIENAGLIYRQGFPRAIFIPYLVLYELKAVRDFTPLFPLALALWDRPKKGMREELLQAFMGSFGLLQDPLAAIVHQEKCLGWITERQEADGTWAGIFQVTLFAMMALHAAGDERHQDAVRKGMEGVVSYQREDRDEVIQQFSVSPVMDTAYALRAVGRAGVQSSSGPVQAAAGWLAGRQSLRAGDWRHNNPDGEPGGWGFEFHNTWYPDLDSTAMTLQALGSLEEGARQLFHEQLDRGLNWVLSMQNWDGGFAVWDKNNWLIFRTLNIVLEVGDYSCADVTARVLQSLAALQRLPRYRGRADLRRALGAATRFLWAHHEGFQRWHGRWNANYTYGTGQVLEALAARRGPPPPPGGYAPRTSFSGQRSHGWPRCKTRTAAGGKASPPTRRTGSCRRQAPPCRRPASCRGWSASERTGRSPSAAASPTCCPVSNRKAAGWTSASRRSIFPESGTGATNSSPPSSPSSPCANTETAAAGTPEAHSGRGALPARLTTRPRNRA